MERQTSERFNLYARRASPGNPLPINYGPIKINGDAQLDKEIRLATSELSNGRAMDASGMGAKQVRDWLWGVQWEEDTKSQGNPGKGIIGDSVPIWSKQPGPTASSLASHPYSKGRRRLP
jgi:hypothetical protein